MPNDNVLKPCPFCGGDVKHTQGLPPLDDSHFIDCPGCGVSSKIASTKEAVIEAWNRRAHPGQPEPRAEVMHEARERRHWNPVYNTDPVQRACAELPEGWGVNACMERDAGWVEVYGPDGEEPNFESDADHFDWRIHEAIDFAIEAACKGDAS